MTAMVTKRASGLEAFRKSWICGDCGCASPVSEEECVSCGQIRGARSPRNVQNVAMNNQGNGVVNNNVLIVGGDLDASDEHYHMVQSEPEQWAYSIVPQHGYGVVGDGVPRQLTAGEKALIAGANVATWASVFVLVPAALFFIFLAVAGFAQIARVIPH